MEAKNPYPKTMTDEISGVQVQNGAHIIWQEGYSECDKTWLPIINKIRQESNQLSPEYQRLREQIAEIINEGVDEGKTIKELADSILSLKGLLVEADEQDVPDLRLPDFPYSKSVAVTQKSFAKKIQNDMLTPDASGNRFVKVVGK